MVISALQLDILKKLQKLFSGTTSLVIVVTLMLLRSTVVKKIRSTALQPPFLLQFIMTTATISAVVTLFGLLVKLCCLFLILAALQTFLLCRHNLVLLNLIMILLWKNTVVNFSHFHFWLTERYF